MKILLCALALTALSLQPAMAASTSCWSSSNGNHLLFPPGAYAATYWHGGDTESCSLHPVTELTARVWCDVSSVSGIVRLSLPHRRPSAGDRVYWDGQVYFRDDCPA